MIFFGIVDATQAGLDVVVVLTGVDVLVLVLVVEELLELLLTGVEVVLVLEELLELLELVLLDTGAPKMSEPVGSAPAPRNPGATRPKASSTLPSIEYWL